jgi:hypothetical protein
MRKRCIKCGAMIRDYGRCPACAAARQDADRRARGAETATERSQWLHERLRDPTHPQQELSL